MRVALTLAVTAAGCAPSLNYNPRVTPDLIVGRWSCPNGVTISFLPDRTLSLVEEGFEHKGQWAFQDWNMFVGLGRRTEDWRVATTPEGEAVLFRHWRDMDPSANDPYCRRLSGP